MSARPLLSAARTWLAAGVLALGLALPAAAEAHTLTMTTARVSLRDDHLDLHLEIDAAALLGQVSGLDPRALGALGEAELAALSARAQAELLTGAALDADGARVPLSLRAFPPVAALRALIARRAASAEGHGELVSVELEGAGSIVGAQQVALRLPPALGEALVTFVQPTTRWIQPGNGASFAVLAPPAAPPPAAAPGSARQPWIAGAAVLLALAAAFSNLSLRRRRVDPHTAPRPTLPRPTPG
jgi:hypothetical protein